jgi:DNA replication licensing factor MCM2
VDPLEEQHAIEEEGSGEDLMGDMFLKDYNDRPELDEYDAADLDQADYGPVSMAARRRAEEELLLREKKERKEQKGGRGNLPSVLESSSEDEEDEEEFMRRRKQRRTDFDLEALEDAALMGDDEEQQYALNLGADQKCPLREYLQMEAIRLCVGRKFRDFLTDFKDANGHRVYVDRINSLCLQNRESLEVKFAHLAKQYAILAIYIIDAPKEMLEIFDRVARLVILRLYPDYDRIHAQIHVRMTELPVLDTLRGIRHTHLNGMITVRGVVTRRTSVLPEQAVVEYNCKTCGFTIGPVAVAKDKPAPTFQCPNKECQSGKRGAFEVNNSRTLYRNFQKIILQESPSSVPAGRLPRTKEVILLWDLVDSVRPGEEIEVTGIYRNSFDARLNTKNGFPVFATVIEANYIGKKEDVYATFRLTEEDEKQIRELAQDPDIGKRIIKSIAPSIYGNEQVKTAVALCLFGGVQKTVDKHRMRGDINLLMLGDPGLAKSQFLKYVEKTASRAIFTNGQGASAVGLTASVQKDPITREWTLSGGAMVLADTGCCLIDEFEKMTDQDRTSILEAMEQQSISVSKAGIVTTLQARCTVMAAANPIRGRYDVSRSFLQNVDLSEPILSRFDILIVLRDTVNPVDDQRLADFVVKSHARSHPDTKADEMETNEDDEDGENAPGGVKRDGTLTQSLLRKYIVYAKQKCKPRLGNINKDKIAKLYSELRHEGAGSGTVITLRHVEATIRMAEACAKMHLREYVSHNDVNTAIKVMLDSFISTQKFSVSRQMQKKFFKYSSANTAPNELLLYQLQNLLRETINFKRLQAQQNVEMDPISKVEISCEDFETRARELQISEVEQFYQSKEFKKNGFVLNGKIIEKNV